MSDKSLLFPNFAMCPKPLTAGYLLANKKRRAAGLRDVATLISRIFSTSPRIAKVYGILLTFVDKGIKRICLILFDNRRFFIGMW